MIDNCHSLLANYEVFSSSIYLVWCLYCYFPYCCRWLIGHSIWSPSWASPAQGSCSPKPKGRVGIEWKGIYCWHFSTLFSLPNSISTIPDIAFSPSSILLLRRTSNHLSYFCLTNPRPMNWGLPKFYYCSILPWLTLRKNGTNSYWSFFLILSSSNPSLVYFHRWWSCRKLEPRRRSDINSKLCCRCFRPNKVTSLFVTPCTRGRLRTGGVGFGVVFFRIFSRWFSWCNWGRFYWGP